VCVVRVVPLLPPVDSEGWVRLQQDAFCLEAILRKDLRYLAAGECRGGRGADCKSHCKRGERWTESGLGRRGRFVYYSDGGIKRIKHTQLIACQQKLAKVAEN
jgi:hypothetical protein